jgi:hypothetical protein
VVAAAVETEDLVEKKTVLLAALVAVVVVYFLAQARQVLALLIKDITEELGLVVEAIQGVEVEVAVLDRLDKTILE